MAALTVAGAHAQSEAAPDDVEIRTVKDTAEPCLNVRERPSYRARIVGCADKGARVTVTGVSRGWSYVVVSDELRGWTGSRFLEGDSAPIPTTEPEPADDARSEPGRGRTASEPVAEPEPLPVEPPSTVDVEEFLRVSAARDRMREQLAAAVAKIEALETEVGTLRDLAKRGAEHSARLEDLSAERDDLALQLAEAEARQLYLLSDLERTRGELMRLKGIPPKLVRNEPPPAPEPPPLPEPEPEPAVEEEAQEAGIELPAVASVVSMDEVVATVRAWADAWSDQRADDYLSFYSSDFDPPEGASRELWAARRRQRIDAPRSIRVTLDRISPMVTGDRATVSFVQRYASDSFEDVVDKTLVLERTDGVWRIVEERTR